MLYFPYKNRVCMPVLLRNMVYITWAKIDRAIQNVDSNNTQFTNNKCCDQVTFESRVLPQFSYVKSESNNQLNASESSQVKSSH